MDTAITTATDEIRKALTPRGKLAQAAILAGKFGTDHQSDVARWWCQDLGLIAGQALTTLGLRLRRELGRTVLAQRHGI